MTHGDRHASIPKLEELTEDQIERATADELRAAYRALVRHHIDETEKLWERLRAARGQT